jgi:TRAP-type C4-dicarboxylate transport system permease small subunit
VLDEGGFMDKLKPIVSKLSVSMAVIAGITLISVMLMTVLDVILRYFGQPITGIYDIVALGGAIVIGFSMPLAAERKVHVYMEMGQQLYGRTMKQILRLFTRLIIFGISFIAAWNLIRLGIDFRHTGEVSLTIKIVYYPIAIGLGACFFIQMLVLVVQIFQVFSGGSDE